MSPKGRAKVKGAEATVIIDIDVVLPAMQAVI
jgi:hypothetical protein